MIEGNCECFTYMTISKNDNYHDKKRKEKQKCNCYHLIIESEERRKISDNSGNIKFGF